MVENGQKSSQNGKKTPKIPQNKAKISENDKILFSFENIFLDWMFEFRL